MGFLQKIMNAKYRDDRSPKRPSSFTHLTEDELEAHMNVSRYGSFTLTDAIRPSYTLDVVPAAGYRHDWYEDKQTETRIPVLLAAVSREDLFDAFLSLLEPLGETVDVVLETSHDQDGGEHSDLYREQIDMPVLQSTLYDFEDMLLDDGHTGIAVLNPRIPMEVQLDEHKLIIVYGRDNEQYEQILLDHCVEGSEQLRFITEAEHVHSSSDEYIEQFRQLQYRLGIDDF